MVDERFSLMWSIMKSQFKTLVRHTAVFIEGMDVNIHRIIGNSLHDYRILKFSISDDLKMGPKLWVFIARWANISLVICNMWEMTAVSARRCSLLSAICGGWWLASAASGGWCLWQLQLCQPAAGSCSSYHLAAGIFDSWWLWQLQM